MFSLCDSQKRQDNFVLSELKYRVSEKLGPAVRKQKINTFKLLKVMHKYLSAIHAGSSRERLRVQIPLVYTFHVFCQEPIYGKAVFVFLFLVSNKISADKVKHG